MVTSRAKLQRNVSMFVSEWKWQSGIKDGHLLSPAVLQVVNIVKENPDNKKIKIFETIIDFLFTNVLLFFIYLFSLYFPLTFNNFYQRQSQWPNEKHIWKCSMQFQIVKTQSQVPKTFKPIELVSATRTSCSPVIYK